MGIKCKKIFFTLFAATIIAVPYSTGNSGGTEKFAIDSLNVRYAKLTERQQALQERLSTVRHLFSANSTNRDVYSAEIVRLEESLFSLRDSIAAVQDELKNSGWTDEGDNEQVTSANSADSRRAYFVSTEYIRNSLPAADYRQLVASQEQERKVAIHLNSIKYNYAQLSGLDTVYAAASKGPRADSLYGMIRRLADTNDELAKSVSAIWMPVFENKVYLYNYLLDRSNMREVMDEMERGMRQMLAESEEIEGEYMYDAVALYPLQKELILAYEIRIAEKGGLDRAADSLRAVARNFDDKSFFMPYIDTSQRLFIDYSDYRVTDKPLYNNSNPVPATQVHPKGTVYRVFVGSFSTVQPISLFRNVSPLSREVKKDKLHYYYIGGYRSYEEAAEAAVKLKKHGFKNPRVVVWVDGRYNDKPTAAATSQTGKNFRLEIRNAEGGLSSDMTALIRKECPGKEISRIPDPNGDGYVFVVGIFDNRAEAEKLLKTVNTADPALKLAIGNI